MATTNYTAGGADRQSCSAELTGGLHYQLTCLSVLNIFLSITAILGNTLILVALHKESSLHPPSKLLLRCLATTDLCVGLIAEPLFVTHWMSAVNQQWNICHYARILSSFAAYLLCSVSLYTMTAMSVDRLLALQLYLRYKQVVTLKRTYVILIIIWVQSIVVAAMSLWNYMYLAQSWSGYIGISLCLVTSTFCYTNIFLRLRNHQTQVQDLVHQEPSSETIPLNIARYKKAVSSALLLKLTLVACYLPYSIAEALTTQIQLSSSVFIASQCTITLVFLNSSLNPLLYCWTIKEVRQAVKETIRKVFCSSS